MESRPSVASYDERQRAAVLRKCIRCPRVAYMTQPHAVCFDCQWPTECFGNWRTYETDVSGNHIDGP